MSKPNFFILGAPKSGTTALAQWLAEHPDVFFSTPKEPNFFNQGHTHPKRRTLTQYERLFSPAMDSYMAVGEGSVHYLRCEAAVDGILRYKPDARFIVCLRSPADMAVSFYGQMRNEGIENLGEFRQAWQAQDRRRDGVDIPSLCYDPSALQYREVCAIGTQVDKLLNKVSVERVCIVILDDIEKNAKREYLRVLHFLGLHDDDRENFNRANEALHLPRWFTICNHILSRCEHRLGFYLSTHVRKPIKLFFGSHSRFEIDSSLLRAVHEHFLPEVELLERVIGRDLSAWK